MTEFISWYKLNALSICIDKWAIVSFSLSIIPVLFDYTLDGQNLERVYCVKDLGVLLPGTDSQIVANSNRLHGLVISITRKPRDPMHFKTLFCTLNRPGSWNTLASARALVRLESIQRKATRFTLRDWPQRLEYRRTRCLLLAIPLFTDRIEHARLAFITRILDGTIGCPELAVAETRTTFGSRKPLLCTCRLLNSVDDLYGHRMTIAELTSSLSVRNALNHNDIQMLCSLSIAYCERNLTREPFVVKLIINTKLNEARARGKINKPLKKHKNSTIPSRTHWNSQNVL